MTKIPAGLGRLLADLQTVAKARAAELPPPATEAPPEAPAPAPRAPETGEPTFTPPPGATETLAPVVRAPSTVDHRDGEAVEEAEAAHEAKRIAALESTEPRGTAAVLDGRTATVTIQIPAPMAHQAQVLDHPARFKAVRAGRRLGKTRLEFIAAVRGHGPIDTDANGIRRRRWKGMAQRGDIVWIAPDYGQADAIWEEEILPRFEGRAGVTISEKHRLVGFGKLLGKDRKGEPIYQGSLRLRSAENINSVRGKRFDGAIIDEAAFLKLFAAWRRVIRPTLVDRKGWAIVASTTDIGSDFNQLMGEIESGKRPNWHPWHFRTRDNPRIDAEELADLALEYAPGSAEEQQELDAELLETLGTLFRAEFFHHYEAISREAVWIHGLRYPFEFIVTTVDLASSLKEQADFTVITTAGVCYPIDGIRRVAIIDIQNLKIEGPEQIDAMAETCLQYRPAYIDIEKVQYQATAVQHLSRRLWNMGLTITGVPVNKDKRTRAVPAASAMARGEWFWPKDAASAGWFADAKAQLLKFPNGKDGSKFVADHDDIVDTLSLLAARVGGRTNSSWKVRKVRTR